MSLPDPILKYTTTKVMLMNYIHGFKMTQSKEMKADGADVDRIINHIVRAYAFQLYVLSFFSGDPHAGEHSRYLLDE